MKINLLNNNTTFKGYYDKYFDKIEDDRFDSFKYIPEYEEKETDEFPSMEYFMRDYELFDKQKDIIDCKYSSYGEDDLEVKRTYGYNTLPQSVFNKSKYIESPYFVTSQKPMPQKPIYTSDDAYNRKQESIQIRLNQGFKKDEIKTIYHSALVNLGETKILDYDMINDGFDLLKSGKDLKDVEEIMNGAKIKYANDTTRYSRELFDFLSENPDARKIVVESKNNCEHLRRDVLKEYARINEVCPSVVDTSMIIKACQLKEKNKKELNHELIELCLDNIKSGKSVKTVTHSMRDAKLTNSNTSESFNKDLFEFFLKNPDSREFIVQKNGESEKIRYDIMKFYPEIKKVSGKKDDVYKIIKTCQVGSLAHKTLDEYFTQECIDKIKNGSSVDDATSLISDAKLYNNNGYSTIDKNLYKFLEKYPEGRNVVVEKGYRNETYRPDIAKVYEIVAEKCKNPDDISYIIGSCITKSRDDVRIDERLLDLALKLLSKNQEWLYEHDAIMYNVKNKRTQSINNKKFELADAMAQGDYSISAIYSAVVLDNKNVERMK